MKQIQLCLLLFAAAFTTGCPKYRPTVDFSNVNTFRGRLNKHLSNEQIKYYCYRDGKDYDDSTDPPHCTGASGSVPNGPARARQVRNDLIDDALSYVDDAYGDFKNGLAAGRDRTNFVADLIELGTSAAVGITKGERPLQILGIGLTAFRGGRRSADANFYKDQSTPILISKMNGNRAAVRAIIISNQAKDIDSYPIGRAISDIVEYYNAGTLVDAFTKLAEDTAVQTKANEKAVRVVRGDLDITDIPTVEAENVSAELFAQQKKLEDELDAATADAEAIPIPSPSPPPPAAPTNTQAINNAKALREAKLKPIRDKLAKIWDEAKAKPAFSSAVAKLRTEDPYKGIIANLEATPPQAVSEEDYLTLFKGLKARLADNTAASKELLALLRQINK